MNLVEYWQLPTPALQNICLQGLNAHLTGHVKEESGTGKTPDLCPPHSQENRYAVAFCSLTQHKSNYSG